jgi:hypothetical protein
LNDEWFSVVDYEIFRNGLATEEKMSDFVDGDLGYDISHAKGEEVIELPIPWDSIYHVENGKVDVLKTVVNCQEEVICYGRHF